MEKKVEEKQDLLTEKGKKIGTIVLAFIFWVIWGALYYYLAPDFGLPRLGILKTGALILFIAMFVSILRATKH